jgi:hypothetical protein
VQALVAFAAQTFFIVQAGFFPKQYATTGFITDMGFAFCEV